MKRSLTTQMCSLALVLGLGPVMALGQVAVALPTDPASVATAYFREFPREAALDLFADDAVMRIVPPLPNTSGVWTGKEEIRQLMQVARGQNLRMEIMDGPKVEGIKVTARTMNHTDLFRQLGVSPVEHTYEFTIEDGKIKSVVSTMTPGEQARVAAARAAAQQAQAGQPSASQPAAPAAGMPRTGGPATLSLIAIIACGLTALSAGVALRRRLARA